MIASVLATRKIINRDTAPAIALVNKFLLSSKSSAFPNVKASRKLIGQDLILRIRDVSKINQAEASLCGPAAFIYCIAKDNPLVYVQYVVDLYTTGEAKIGDLSVKPSGDCKRADIQRSTSASNIAGVDWIALASLRDSSNSLFDFQSPSNQISGITLPSMLKGWFKKAGYSAITDETNLYFDKDLACLAKAQKYYNSGHNVCLFISAKVSYVPSAVSVIPDHWVVLANPVQANTKILSIEEIKGSAKQNITMEVYSWGNIVNIINSKLTAYDFTDYFFGFLAVK